MKKLWLWLPLLILITLAVFWLKSASETPRSAVTHLPWQIEITPKGHTRVFDIEVGATTLQQAASSLMVDPEVALFQAPDTPLRLEAYLGKIKLGPFQARVILRLDAPPALLAEFAANSLSNKATPSGSRQLRLSSKDFNRARELTISELSYSPAVDTEPDLLLKRFGEPEARIAIDDNSTYWTYPDKGLVILMNTSDKEVFHYFPPGAFTTTLKNIQHIKASAAITGNQE